MHNHEEIKFSKYTGPRFIVRVLLNALGLWVAARISSSISFGDTILELLLAGLLLSMINAVIRPIVIILALPAIVLTLGLTMLLVNGFMIYLLSWLYSGFSVETFGSAINACIIVWIVNYCMSLLLTDKKADISFGEK